MQQNEPTNVTQEEKNARQEEKLNPNFILIDNDPINNVLCSTIIERIVPGAEIREFTEPEKGLEFLKHKANNFSSSKAILYLDINMPGMNGWQFMEAFEKLDNEIKEKVVIYILSSSIDPRDMEKAKNNRYIIDYFIKPLRKENVISSQKYLEQISMG